ncbi:lysophospholipid acyltransferase family protein [Caballeronia grimmiae]|jgi:1-acyl-sn-glycerol-3-phosphate acyltransferase|uniref:Acyltransferase n=1 Tax=Caballeronia grimmiae TaxID=1071679 RepID=A0A069P3I9_9BURK|nr:lysophospholipid acyltransferase family protein [Caballeronia grimmiae]KDR34474.1 glycerol acyltransferase [Caballeronia grimmiae]GGD61494.1 acyltransferase [Caballeronia grimmiae]
MKALDHYWRLVATALAFSAFGVCGLGFSLIVFPLACVWPHRASKQRIIAAIIHAFFRALVAVLIGVRVMKLDVRGADALNRKAQRAAIVVANHPTWLDVMVLLSLTPRACCVVKSAHWSNPFFWGVMRAADYVSNADPVELVEAGARQLARGYTMIIFPEGTRSPARNRLHAFSRGFAHMALQSGAPILPVLMDCDPPAFTKNMRWHDVPERPFHMRVNVLDAVGADALANRDEPPALAARTVTNALQAHITEHLIDHGFFKA